MKKLSLAVAIAAAFALTTPMARAQAGLTSSGALTVSATVQGTLSLVFNSDASGIALTGSGTNAATLAFGTVSAYGTCPAGATCTVGTGNFTVSSPVDVYVSTANVTSANYNLTAALGTADAVNTWKVGGTTMTTTAASVGATLGYNSNNGLPVAITIPFTTASGTVISDTINFTATSN